MDDDIDVDALTFEQLLDELERTIDRMAGGTLGIEEVTDLYERAGRLHAAAAQRLAGVQERIEKLTGRPAGEARPQAGPAGEARPHVGVDGRSGVG